MSLPEESAGRADGTITKLLLAIVQTEDANLLLHDLTAKGVRVTRIKTIGGFLLAANVTLLVGINDDQLPDVLASIRRSCTSRVVTLQPFALAPEMMNACLIDVEVGGATVFVLPVEQFLQL